MEKKRTQRKWSKLPIKQILFTLAVLFVAIPALCLLIPGEEGEEEPIAAEQQQTTEQTTGAVNRIPPQQQYDDLKKEYLKKLEQYLSRRDFTNGIRACETLPRQFQPRGELEAFYGNDLAFQEKIVQFLNQFEELRKKQKKEEEEILH